MKTGQNTFTLSHQPVSTWDTPHPSQDSRMAAPESPLFQEGYLKSLQLKPPPQGSWRVRSESLLPFLTIVDTTNKLTVSLETQEQPGLKETGVVLINLWKIQQKYPSFILSIIPLFWWPAWNVRYWHVYSEVWSCNFLLMNVFHTCDIKDLELCLNQSVLDSWFGLWNEVFQAGIRYVSFFPCMKRLEVISSLITLG